MNDIVVSLDTAQRLKVAGFPQGSPIVWHHSIAKRSGEDVWYLYPGFFGWTSFQSPSAVTHRHAYEDGCAAPTFQELWSQIPEESRDARVTHPDTLALIWLKLHEVKS